MCVCVCVLQSLISYVCVDKFDVCVCVTIFD